VNEENDKKYIKLLDRQIDKLLDSDFDLDAWKSSTIYILTLIFGSDDPKIREVNDLKIDYSSWALRDSRSDYKPIETCKKKGREILEIARDEIELFGIPQPDSNGPLKEVLTEEAYHEFMAENSTDEIKRGILKSLKKDQLLELLLKMVQGNG